MAAKSIICSGVRRGIRNGESTLICAHPWLQDDHDPMIQTEMPIQLEDAKVVGLIDQQTGSWDHSILTDLFQPNDVANIIKIPVSPEYDDMWYWHGDPREIYSVKCGYRLIVGNYESGTGTFTKWLTLWKLKIPRKWKMFLWRAICDILPTTTNLLIKRVDVDPQCAMCGISQEDTIHALVLCEFAKNIWERSNLPIPNIVTNIFHIWFGELLNVLDSDGIVYAASILYNIWRAWNGAVWNACLPHPSSLVTAARITMQARQPATARIRTAPSTASHPVFRATRPAPSRRICHVNAGYVHGSGKATVGAILLDVDGGYVSALTAPLLDCSSPLMAETLACKEALSWLKDRGEQHINIYTDCLTLQRYLTTPPAAFRSYVGYAIDSCRAAVSLFQSCSVNYITRLDNYLAHALATSTYQQHTAMYWDVYLPDIISTYF
ncbi:PREDICTED: uncharacterized protein LOC109187347 [Ipomoea nil]|uniref:uncharacterized protein LOC109187347 n=1 Tax=Ipomoea nil TaxID=35883 RepID=UPI00090101C4|nr:PREDICTED: uncharacterized protein LOC109187347 [Ipomoea nil]